jgi:hypothetical protein
MSEALKTADLPPETLEFIRAGTPKPKTEKPIIAVASRETVATPAEPQIELQEEAVPEAPRTLRKLSAPREEAAAIPSGSVVGFSFRLATHLHQALMKASFERKLRAQKPFTHQEIVAEALGAWLKKQGYL